MSTEPTSKLVWSTDPTVKTERPQHRTPRHTFLVFQPHVAAHLANLGHVVEQIVIQGDRVCWTAPIAAEADRDRYQVTLRILEDARRLTQQRLQEVAR